LLKKIVLYLHQITCYEKVFLLHCFNNICFILKNSQSYIGSMVDNFAGIHGVVYNPANIVNSPYKVDVNLISVSGFGGSDYFSIDFNNIIDPADGYDFEDDTTVFPKDNNNFFFNVDVLEPSFMFNLSEKSSIGLITRLRGFSNVNEISGVLFENVSNDLDDEEDFSFNSPNLNTTFHTWSEIGLSYGRILLDKPNHMLSGGATLKYLIGCW